VAKKIKPGAIIRQDWRPLLQFLSDAEFRQLIMAALDYAADEPDGIETIFSGQLAMVWAYVKPKLDEDKATYEAKSESQRAKANKRWHPDELLPDATACHSMPQQATGYHGMPLDADDANRIERTVSEKNIPPYSPPKGGVCEEVVNYLNHRIGSTFQLSKRTAKFINDQVKEGRTLEDFKMVIDFKASQWENDPKHSQYLRPSTLFGANMEDYVQAAKRSKSKMVDDIYAGLL
jgi:uncharacterized phage protein (TIGR02220 family)